MLPEEEQNTSNPQQSKWDLLRRVKENSGRKARINLNQSTPPGMPKPFMRNTPSYEQESSRRLTHKAPPMPQAPSRGDVFSRAQKGFAKGYNKIPVAGQIAHAVLNPITGIPMAIGAHWDGIKKGVQKFGSKIKDFGKRAVGGIANAFRRR